MPCLRVCMLAVLTRCTRAAGFLPKPLRLDALRAVLATHNLLSPAGV